MRLRLAMIAPLIGMALTLPAKAADVSLTVNADKVVKSIDPRLYGHFFEHIYHSANGGLWGDVVWNRSFEEAPPVPRPAGRGRGTAASGPATAVAPAVGATGPAPFPIRHWSPVGNGTVTADVENPLNTLRSAKIVARGEGAGIEQANYALKTNDTLRGSLFVRGALPEGAVVRLVEGTRVLAEQAIGAPEVAWKEVPLVLAPTGDSRNATLRITAKGAGTFWLDQVSLMPDSSRANDGFRPDLLKAMADLKPATIRWPGGSFVGTAGGYHWKKGIGPQSKREGKVGWDEWEPASLGTDEFMTLCKRVNAEPVIVVYLGSRTPGANHAADIQEACDWLEYCNGPVTSKWGAERAKNGHPEPYHVKYWEIDNEVWGMDAADYVRVVREFMTALKKVDPTITGIACGSGGFGARFKEGDFAVIADASDVVDFLSIHHYESVGPEGSVERVATGPAKIEAYVKTLAEAIAKSKNPSFKIYMSEWNAQSTDWRTGIYAGGVLNTLERDPSVTMACPALWLRHSSAPAWDNAFINFDQNGWFPAPNYVVMKLFRDSFAPTLVQVTGDAGQTSVNASKSEDGGKLFVKAVNPTDQPVTVKLTIDGNFKAGAATLRLVAPDSLSARNTFEQREAVKVVTSTLPVANGGVTMTLPRWSVGVAEVSK